MNEEERKKAVSDALATAKSGGFKLLGALVLVLFIYGTFGYNPAGVVTRVQTPMLGHTWHTEEGFYPKAPLVSKVRSYSKDITVAVTDNESTTDTASISEDPRVLQFADTYKIRMEYSMRFRLPIIKETLESMHQSVKSEDNLLGNTLMPFALTLAGDTANQMLAGDYAQGGRNAFRNRMADQATNGMLATVVREEPVKGQAADTDANRDPNETKDAKQFIKKVVILKDESGKNIRIPTAISAYGITMVQNSLNIIESEPVDRLVTFIDNKQSSLGFQIAEQEAQVLERSKAKTAQLRGATNLVTTQNTLNIEKETAVIKGEKTVAVAALAAEKELVDAQKVADLAVIDKTRELQISRANEGIQRANDKAATFEASSIKKVGFAEAAVTAAKQKAVDKGVLALNVERDKALALYASNMRVELPKFVGSSGGGASNPISDMSNLKIMEMYGEGVTPKSQQ